MSDSAIYCPECFGADVLWKYPEMPYMPFVEDGDIILTIPYPDAGYRCLVSKNEPDKILGYILNKKDCA